MAEQKDKWIKVITKIIKKTQEKEIEWEISRSPKKITLNDDAYVEAVFVSLYKDNRYLRLYKKHFKSTKYVDPIDTLTSVSAGKFLGQKQKESYWIDKIYLEIVDSNNNILFEFPNKQSLLNDLLNSVKYQVSGVSDLISDLLNEDE